MHQNGAVEEDLASRVDGDDGRVREEHIFLVFVFRFVWLFEICAVIVNIYT